MKAISPTIAILMAVTVGVLVLGVGSANADTIPSTWAGVSQSPNADGTIDSLPVTLVLDSSDPISGVMKIIGPQHTWSNDQNLWMTLGLVT